jgi:tetratricopeptide (TPR) repeat protein
MSQLLAVLLLSLAPLQDKKQDDVLQKKDGGLLVGKVTKLEVDSLEMLVNGEREARKLYYRDLMPYSVYKVRLDRAEKANGAARLELGEFCMATGLYTQAGREFEEAARLDKSLEAKAKKRKEEAHFEDARSKFEEAKKHHQKRELDEAIKLLNFLLDARYEGTPYPAEAKALLAKIAEEVKAEKEELQKQLAAKSAAKDAQKAAVAANQEADLYNRTIALFEEAQKDWTEGLEHEGKGGLSRADRAWKAAEAALMGAKRNIDAMLKSNDVDTIKKGKDLDRQADGMLCRVYYRLGRLWAVELSYPTALEWLNKAMKVPHDEAMDRLINDVLLTISQLKMRERAAGRGY